VIEAAYELSSRISSETAAALPSSLRQRARCVVVASGRLAQRTNQAYEYLYKHPPSKVAADIAQLKARAERTTDDLAKKTLLDAAAVRGRELATINAMLATSERVHARLDHAAATLRACTAAAVAAGSENAEFSLVQTTLDDRVDELGTELDVVEETTAETAASLDA
jgi:hypothetical protein